MEVEVVHLFPRTVCCEREERVFSVGKMLMLAILIFKKCVGAPRPIAFLQNYSSDKNIVCSTPLENRNTTSVLWPAT